MDTYKYIHNSEDYYLKTIVLVATLSNLLFLSCGTITNRFSIINDLISIKLSFAPKAWHYHKIRKLKTLSLSLEEGREGGGWGYCQAMSGSCRQTVVPGDCQRQQTPSFSNRMSTHIPWCKGLIIVWLIRPGRCDNKRGIVGVHMD